MDSARDAATEPLKEYFIDSIDCTSEGRTQLARVLLTFLSDQPVARATVVEAYNRRCFHAGFSSHKRVKSIRRVHLSEWTGTVHLCLLVNDTYTNDNAPNLGPVTHLDASMRVVINSNTDLIRNEVYQFRLFFDDTNEAEQAAWIEIIKTILTSPDFSSYFSLNSNPQGVTITCEAQLMELIYKFVTLPEYTYITYGADVGGDDSSDGEDGGDVGGDDNSDGEDGGDGDVLVQSVLKRRSFSQTLLSNWNSCGVLANIPPDMAQLRMHRCIEKAHFENVLSVDMEYRNLNESDAICDRLGTTFPFNAQFSEHLMLRPATQPTPTFNLTPYVASSDPIYVFTQLLQCPNIVIGRCDANLLNRLENRNVVFPNMNDHSVTLAPTPVIIPCPELDNHSWSHALAAYVNDARDLTGKLGSVV